MNYDPLSEVIDEPISVSNQDVEELKSLRESEKFVNLPGTDTTTEQIRLAQVFNELLDHLIIGVLENSNKLWVLSHFKSALEKVQMEDTEGREHFGEHLEKVMDILQIESSDGLLDFYL